MNEKKEKYLKSKNENNDKDTNNEELGEPKIDESDQKEALANEHLKHGRKYFFFM